LKGLFQLLLSPYIITSSSILRRGFRSRQTDRLSSRHLAPQALMLMPMIMSGTVMATATLAAMISLRIMSSSVCDGAQTVMEGGKAFTCGVKAARTHQLASLGLWLTISPDHFSPGSKHSTRCRNLFLALRSAIHPVTRPATRDQAETLARPVLPCGAGTPSLVVCRRPPFGKTRRGLGEGCAAHGNPA
jgi:hypothetical protein